MTIGERFTAGFQGSIQRGQGMQDRVMRLMEAQQRLRERKVGRLLTAMGQRIQGYDQEAADLDRALATDPADAEIALERRNALVRSYNDALMKLLGPEAPPELQMSELKAWPDTVGRSLDIAFEAIITGLGKPSNVAPEARLEATIAMLRRRYGDQVLQERLPQLFASPPEAEAPQAAAGERPWMALLPQPAPAAAAAPAAAPERPPTAEAKPRETTTLTPDDERQFRDWYGTMAQANRLNPDPDNPQHFYDWRGYWKQVRPPIGYRGELSETDQDYHFPDQFKLPGHPTLGIEEAAAAAPAQPVSWEDILRTRLGPMTSPVVSPTQERTHIRWLWENVQQSPTPNPAIVAEIIRYNRKQGIVRTPEEEAGLVAYIVASNERIQRERKVAAFLDLVRAAGMQLTPKGVQRAAQVLDMADLFAPEGEAPPDISELIAAKPAAAATDNARAQYEQWARAHGGAAYIKDPQTGEARLKQPGEWSDEYKNRVGLNILQGMTVTSAKSAVRAEEAAKRAAARAARPTGRPRAGGAKRPVTTAWKYRPELQDAIRWLEGLPKGKRGADVAQVLRTQYPWLPNDGLEWLMDEYFWGRKGRARPGAHAKKKSSTVDLEKLLEGRD